MIPIDDSLIGRPVDELPTPLLLLDRDVLAANLESMREATADKTALRPHAKIHKCAEIARMQLSAGAIGITVATVREASALLRRGLAAEVLVANEVVPVDGIGELVACAAEATILVAIDDSANAEQLSRAAAARGVRLGALVDVDVGMQRCGVRTEQEALAVARAVAGLPGLELRGVMGYEGHVVLERDAARRASLASAAMDMLADRVAALTRAGLEVDIVSAGGTNTFATTAAHPVVTELQAGTYALMDTAYAPFAPRFRPAISVLGTVISRHDTRIVLDCGSKTVGLTDLAPPSPIGAMTVIAVDEEHTLLDLADADDVRPRPGDRVRIVVGYCGATVNLHDAYCVISGDRVVDVWPILARGPGREHPGARQPHLSPEAKTR